MNTNPLFARQGPLTAIAFMILGLGALGSQDVPMKNLSAHYSVVQLLFVRSIFALLLFQLVLWCISRRTALDTDRLGWHLLRGGVLCGALGCYYLALSAMSLLDAVAIFFTGPLFAAAMSAVMLRERISLGRWLGIVAGFGGALIMIRPGGEGVIQAGSVFAFAAAVMYAVSIVLTRYLGATESAVTTAYLTMVMYVGVTGVALSTIDFQAGSTDVLDGVSLIRPVSVMTIEELVVMLLSAAMVCVGFFCLAHAYKLGEVALLTPWEYTSLLWAGLWGYIFLNEVPTATGLVGAAIIVVSGLYVTREST
tara:strand:+ start:70 stop:996 length:927 start_codon:yes stop_codon:yes gene_type:complete